ncbi:hypothetical protein IBX73_07610 [candidate division WOR-3 bacterium]|nr:hypothetical protein [candidate division WOR-3 bacterium]
MARDHDLSGRAGALTWVLPHLAHGATAGVVVLTESEALARSYPAIYLALDLGLTYVCYKAFAQRGDRIGKAYVPRLNVSFSPVYLVKRDDAFSGIAFCSMSYLF